MHFRPKKFWRFKSRRSENDTTKVISKSTHPSRDSAGSASVQDINPRNSTISTKQPADGPTKTDDACLGNGPVSSEIRFSSSELTVPLPNSPKINDPAGSECMKWLVRCKVGLQLFETALAGVPVPGLKAAVGSVALIIEKFEIMDGNVENIKRLSRAIHDVNDRMPRDGPSPLRLSNELTERIECIIRNFNEKNAIIKAWDASSDSGIITELFDELDYEIRRLQLQSSSHIESMAWNVLEIAQQEKIKSRLQPVKEARWNQAPGVNECLDETRISVLKQVEDWMDGRVSKQIYWLRGMAGTGKSTLAKTVCRRVKERCRLGGSFFCSRYYEGRRDEKRIIPTIAEQLCWSVEGFGAELLKLNNLEDVGLSVLQQLKELIVDPLSRLSMSASTIVVVIDALDECEGNKAAYTLLLALSHVAAKIPGFKAFITSRPEREILNAFEIQSLAKMTNVLSLDLVLRTEVDGDIDKFFRERLTGLAEENNGGKERDYDWPPPLLVKQLVSISGGLFVFAHTLCEFAAGTELSYRVVIEDYARQSPSDGNDLQALDKLYGSIISEKINKLGGIAGHRGKRCHAILATIILLKTPLSVTALNALLGFSDVFELIDRFRSILYIPDKDDSKEVIRIIHASLQDLLTSSQRLSSVSLSSIYVDPSVRNRVIVERLWNLMLDNLCRKPYSVIDEENRDEALVYACRFWAEHLKSVVNETAEETKEGVFIRVAGALQEFISKKLLNWIEALSLLGSLDLAVSTLLTSQDWCKSFARQHPETNISVLILSLSDAHRLVLEFFDCIEADPSQVYVSALPFVPETSPLRKMYSNNLRNAINILTTHTQWNPCLRTMQAGRDREIRQVTISPDSHTIACVIRRDGDNMVMAWDGKAGRLKWINKNVFEEHGTQDGLVFFLGGACVVELTEKGKVLTLDPENGIVNKVVEGFVARILPNRYPSVIDQPLEGVAPSYFQRTTRVHWPLDDQLIAETIVNLDHSQVLATSQVMSECGTFLVYGMKTGCVETWDGQLGELLKTFASHARGWVLCVACSPDAKYIAGGGNAVEIWNMESGDLVSTLRGHNRQVTSIVFSPDGQQLISGSDDGTIKIWDWTFTQRQTNIGHTLRVTSVSFVPDNRDVLMSTSWDGTVFAWNIDSHPSPYSTSASFRMQRDFIGDYQLKSIAGTISRDGELFAATRERRLGDMIIFTDIFMWRIKSADAPMTQITDMEDIWHCVALSRDGALLALACFDGQFCICSTSDTASTSNTFDSTRTSGTTSIYSTASAGSEDSLVGPDADNQTYFAAEEYLHDTPHELRMSGQHLILITNEGKQERREHLLWRLLPDGAETLERVNLAEQAYFIHDGWIKDAGSNFKGWIPPIYRGRDCYCVSGNRMALGGEDGGIMLIELPTSESRP